MGRSASILPLGSLVAALVIGPLVWAAIRPAPASRGPRGRFAASALLRIADSRDDRRENPAATSGDPDGQDRVEREAWFEERHRVGPGVSWRQIERTNRRREVGKRNKLSQMRPSGGPDSEAQASSSWREIGSRNQAGRMHAARHSSDGQRLYAGSSAGGVWRSTDLDGTDWEPLGDNLAGGAHELEILPGAFAGAPDVIVRGTSDLWVSRDEGLTWELPTGLPSNLNSVRRLRQSSDGSNTLYVVLSERIGIANHYGVYRSTDLALSFTKIRGLGLDPGDLWTRRDGSPDVYVLEGNAVSTSIDRGDSWSVAGSLPAAVKGGELTGSEAGAPRLWVVGRAGGARKLYRSDDAGGSWTFKRDVSDYWDSMNASIVDADRFAWGGVEVHRTTDGGDTFQIVNGWGEYYGNPAGKLHADVPGIDVLPDGGGGELWYVATDGGLFRSTDGLLTVENLSLQGLRVSQYYSTHTSSANTDHVVAGAQDQGYQRADVPAPGLDHLLDFDQMISGDYGHLTSGNGSHTYLYSVYPGFVLIQIGEDFPQLAFADFPSGESYGWMPTVTADPLHLPSFFFCATKLYRYSRVGMTFGWSSTIWSGQSFQASSGEYLTAVAFSPLDPQRAFAATSHGRLFHSLDQGVSWTQSTTTGPSAHYFYGTALLPSATDVDTVTVGGSGYSNPAVYRSTDGGVTFAPWSEGLPSTLVYCLGESPDGSGAVFAGTELSAYRRDPQGGTWLDVAADEAPLTTYWSVEAVADQNVMRFGTYGRGIWDFVVGPTCRYEVYGVGVGGANVLTLDSTSSTKIGTSHVLSLSGGQPLAAGALLVSLNSASLPAFGGTLLVDISRAFSIPVTASIWGARDTSVPIPMNPNLVGISLYGQGALLDPNQSRGWAFSNGLRGELCE